MTVTYERDESGWWVAQVKEEPGAITQGRTVEEARRRIREALAALWDDEPRAARVLLKDDVRLPPRVRRAVAKYAQVVSQRQKLEKTIAETIQAAIQTIGNEFDPPLSVRDTGALLGVCPHQAIGADEDAVTRSVLREEEEKAVLGSLGLEDVGEVVAAPGAVVGRAEVDEQSARDTGHGLQ